MMMSEKDDIRAKVARRRERIEGSTEPSNVPVDAANQCAVSIGEAETLLRKLDEAEADRDALQARVDAADPIIEAVAHIGVDFGYGTYELEEKHIHASRVLIDQKESER